MPSPVPVPRQRPAPVSSRPRAEVTSLGPYPEATTPGERPRATAGQWLRDGVAAARDGDSARALALLREATARDPGDQRAWLWRASVTSGFAEAFECVTQALALEPDHPQALAALAALRQRAAQAQEASAPEQAATPVGETPGGLAAPAPPPAQPTGAATVARGFLPDRHAAPRATGNMSGEPRAPEYRRAPTRTVVGFSPAATLLRVDPADVAGEVARPGSVLHLFDGPGEPGPAAETGDTTSRSRPAASHPIGFRPPFSIAAPHQVDGDASGSPAPSRGAILVVDDSPAVTGFVVSELERRRFAVVAAASGPEALQRLLSFTPDIVMVDADMPLMDGYQVCRAIRGEDRSRLVPVLILTTGGGLAERIRCRLAGASGLLVKPLDTDELVDVIERHLPVRF